MIGRWNRCLICFAAFVSALAAAQTPGLVTIRVLTDGQNCIVYTQQMPCHAVGAYLRDNRLLPLSQPINVSPDGDGYASQARGVQVGRYLKRVGYSKIVAVAFITEPGAARATSP
jgi:hypothetical protein